MRFFKVKRYSFIHPFFQKIIFTIIIFLDIEGDDLIMTIWKRNFKELSKIVTGSIFQVSNIIKEDYPEDGRNRWYKASENSSVKDISAEEEEEVIAFSKVLGNYYFNHKIIFNNMNRN